MSVKGSTDFKGFSKEYSLKGSLINQKLFFYGFAVKPPYFKSVFYQVCSQKSLKTTKTGQFWVERPWSRISKISCVIVRSEKWSCWFCVVDSPAERRHRFGAFSLFSCPPLPDRESQWNVLVLGWFICSVWFVSLSLSSFFSFSCKMIPWEIVCLNKTGVCPRPVLLHLWSSFLLVCVCRKLVAVSLHKVWV